MSFNFPNTPAIGDIYADLVSGTRYVWNGVVWRQVLTSKKALGSPFKRTIITASGNFDFDAATLFADIEVCGGGGGTGGCAAGGLGWVIITAGGGGGGYAKRLIQITNAVRAATKVIVVGAGGAYGSGSTNGTKGGDSSYDDTVNTLLGKGGNGTAYSGPTSSMLQHTGAAGGDASGGDVNIPGKPGQPSSGYGTAPVGSVNSAANCIGHGGASVLGPGGYQPNSYSATTGGSASAGVSPAGGFGGGGSGAGQTNSSTACYGAAGAPGVVIISEYR